MTDNARSKQLSKQLIGPAAQLLPYFDDDTVTDVLINGAGSLYLERGGNLIAVSSPFLETRALMDLVERLLIPLGKRIDAAHPFLDGRLADGSRFHILLPPIAVRGPLISIRKARRPTLCPLESFGTVELMHWLVRQVRAGQNLLIAGGTGAGKTTLLARLLDQVSPDERIAVIEETREIESLHPHQISLEARPPSPDGAGEVTLRQLVRNALRMRPSRLILGECRGEEAFDLIQAMNTGHPGSLCTVHANGALDALRRLEGLVLMSGLSVALRTVREWVGSAISIVIFLEKQGDRRHIAEVISLQGTEGEVYRILPKYRAPRGEDT